MYRERVPSWLKRFDFLLFDIFALEISFVISYMIRCGFISEDYYMPELYINTAMALVIISVIESIFFQNYDQILKRNEYNEFKSSFKRATYITVMLIVYLYLIRKSSCYSRTIYVITWELTIIFTFTFRQLWKRVVKSVIKGDDKTLSKFIVVTNYERALNIIKSVSGSDSVFQVAGIVIVDKEMIGDKIGHVDVVASGTDIEDYLCRNWVDEVFVCLDDNNKNLEEKIIEDCIIMGITVHRYLASDLKITSSGVKFVSSIGDYSVLSYSMKILTFRQIVLKRCMDIVGGLVGMIITIIIGIFIAPVIFIKSPGPVIFKQWRIGRNGKKFQIYKFRSMYLDAEERKAELMAKNKIKDGMMFKLENDPRIIGGENGKGIGNFIRNTSLDEFPQFLNVLKGDMSLVGTRPPTMDEWEKYKLHHRKRMAIKPGLTGLWQVSGRSDITDFEEVVKLDTEYINNCSTSYDILIILKTIKVVLFRKGSY
ncbi:MAG: sugar transferase [Lachnospiraceae bacterium]|nr:sugar transferase [Lachnospiraceae bacterium]